MKKAFLELGANQDEVRGSVPDKNPYGMTTHFLGVGVGSYTYTYYLSTARRPYFHTLSSSFSSMNRTSRDTLALEFIFFSRLRRALRTEAWPRL